MLGKYNARKENMPRTILISTNAEYSLFCRWLKTKLKENKIKQSDFEEYLGISHSAFNHRLNENGNSEWTLKDYLKSLDYFGAKPDDVFK